jgi:pimeloyl-ACP methyl ester carboxylesterase
LGPFTRPFCILSPGLPPISDRRAAWYKLISHAHRIEDLESWISQFIKGTIIVTDSDGHPYISARSEQLEHLRAAFDNSMDGMQVISLNASGVPLPGQVYLRSGIALPPPAWPDFFVDLVMGCNLVIGQMEQAHDHLLRAPHGLGYYRQLLAVAGWTSLPWLHQLRQPTLIVAGDDDPIVPPVNARVMACLIPHARLHAINGGHLLLLTEREQVAPLVYQFLREE